MLYRVRVESLAERRDWSRAADVLTRLGRVDPANPWYGHVEAIVRAWAGDTDGCRRVCREMLDRFGTTAHPTRDRWAARDCLLMPGAIPDLRALEPLLALMPSDLVQTGNTNDYLYSQWTRGLYADRAGDPGAALEAYRFAGLRFQMLFRSTVNSLFASARWLLQPTTHVSTAIASQHAGHPAEARCGQAPRRGDEVRPLS